MRKPDCWLAFFLLFIAVSSGAAQAETIVMAMENDCPYSCDVRQEGRAGFIQDILKTIFEKNGNTLEVKLLPWQRALNSFNMQRGELDGMIGMKTHPVREGIAVFPQQPIAQYTHRFYARKDAPFLAEWKYAGPDSLDGIRLGAVKGWNYCDRELTRHIQNGQPPLVQALHGEAPAERNFSKLLGRRIDMWVANQFVAEYFLLKKREAGDPSADAVTGFQAVPITGEVNVYPIFYNTDAGKTHAREFDQGMRALQESGELEKIMAAYGVAAAQKP